MLNIKYRLLLLLLLLLLWPWRLSITGISACWFAAKRPRGASAGTRVTHNARCSRCWFLQNGVTLGKLGETCRPNNHPDLNKADVLRKSVTVSFCVGAPWLRRRGIRSWNACRFGRNFNVHMAPFRKLRKIRKSWLARTFPNGVASSTRCHATCHTATEQTRGHFTSSNLSIAMKFGPNVLNMTTNKQECENWSGHRCFWRNLDVKL